VRLKLRTKTALLITLLVLALVGATGGWQYRSVSGEYVDLMREQQRGLRSQLEPHGVSFAAAAVVRDCIFR